MWKFRFNCTDVDISLKHPFSLITLLLKRLENTLVQNYSQMSVGWLGMGWGVSIYVVTWGLHKHGCLFQIHELKQIFVNSSTFWKNWIMFFFLSAYVYLHKEMWFWGFVYTVLFSQLTAGLERTLSNVQCEMKNLIGWSSSWGCSA